MQLLKDIHHITFITADMDRLLAFYERIFDIRAVVDLAEEGLRHAMIQVNPGCFLHPFEIPGVEPPDAQPMFQRGRLDHFAFQAASQDAFREIRRRAMREGSTDGTVTDMGSIWILSFTDPDQGRHEVVWMKPGASFDAGLKRADWTLVDME